LPPASRSGLRKADQRPRDAGRRGDARVPDFHHGVVIGDTGFDDGGGFC
jgi:hypothetical protein